MMIQFFPYTLFFKRFSLLLPPVSLAIQLGEGAREQGTGGFWVGVKAIGESPKGRRSLGLRESAPICFPVTGWSREVLVLP